MGLVVHCNSPLTGCKVLKVVGNWLINMIYLLYPLSHPPKILSLRLGMRERPGFGLFCDSESSSTGNIA